MFDQQTAGGQEVMNVVTEVLEKVVGINWRALVIPSVAFASSSQSSDKTIHQNHEIHQNEVFLMSNLEFCCIYIQDVVFQTKYFLF